MASSSAAKGDSGRGVWGAFTEEERRHLTQEDSDTWGTVIPLLLFVICGGVLGMAITVAWCVGH